MDYAKRLDDIAKSHGGIVVEKYINWITPILFRCSEGHEWKTAPHVITKPSGSWCPICSAAKNRKYNCDFDFFNRDTEESFYWAGFIAADGWVINKNYVYTLGISLSTKDLKHLEKFKKDICAEQPISIFIKPAMHIANNKNISPPSEICSIKLHSKKIVESLERFGIVQAKTYKLNIPEWLKNHELVRHFLRGYIDGDGCFCLARNKGQDPHVFFAMKGTADFLNSFNDIMKINDVSREERRKRERLVGKKELMFDVLKYGGNAIISRMYHYLYDDATVFLERKEEIAKKATEWVVDGINRVKKPKPRIATKEQLLEMAKQYRSQTKIAEILKCTSANISWMTKEYGIREEFAYNIKGYNVEEIVSLYNNLQNYSAVGKRFTLNKTTVMNIVKKYVKSSL
jgi:hypothetical protein